MATGQEEAFRRVSVWLAVVLGSSAGRGDWLMVGVIPGGKFWDALGGGATAAATPSVGCAPFCALVPRPRAPFPSISPFAPLPRPWPRCFGGRDGCVSGWAVPFSEKLWLTDGTEATETSSLTPASCLLRPRPLPRALSLPLPLSPLPPAGQLGQ